MIEKSVLFWFILTTICITSQGFYSMLEMACVSFSKVRLQYHLSKKSPRAVWIQHLLSRPSRLFGTTLLGVNIALQVGSECSRNLYTALNLSPDLAPFTQVVFVLIFAELTPMFAARRFPEHVVMLGIPIVYFSYRVFRPIIWVINGIAAGVNRLFRKSALVDHSHLTREELQRVLEGGNADHLPASHEDEVDIVVSNIFNLRAKSAKNIMLPLWSVPLISANTRVNEMEQRLSSIYFSYLTVYHRDKTNIIGVAHPRDFLRANPDDLIYQYIRPPWFITQDSKIMDILEQFRQNNQDVAIVLNQHGHTIGILTLGILLKEVFGDITPPPSSDSAPPLKMIKRTFPGNFLVSEFNKKFNSQLEHLEDETLSAFMIRHLGHLPKDGESIQLGSLELLSEESSLLDIKKLSIKTLL